MSKPLVCRLLSLFLILFTLPCFAQESGKAAQLKDLIQSANIPGIQLIYSKDGRPQSYNIGVVSSRSTQPVTDASIFEAASLSKAVFAYTVLRLVDKGVIALDTPLLHYIGGRYERFDPANPAYEKITARLVLSHKTGFRNWADPGVIPLLFPPDSCFNYSGEANMFLMDVVQQVTHKDLEQLAEEETFGPLGMHHSSFRWDPKFAGVSTFGSDTNAVKGHNTLYAASSLLTSATDYNMFLDALASGKGLAPQTHRLMLSQQAAGNWFNHPVIPATAHIGWGLGVGIQYNEKGTGYWQWGDNGDFKAFYIFFPASHEQLVYFTYSARGLYIMQDVIDLFLGKQTTWLIQWVKNGYPTPYDIGYAQPYGVNVLRQQLMKDGFNRADDVWKKIKKRDPGFTLPETDLRVFAGILGERGEVKNALAILKLNATLYPGNPNALAALAAGYRDTNDKQTAIEYVRKSLAVDPTNKDAQTLLMELTKK